MRDSKGRFVKGYSSWNKGLHICLGGGHQKGTPAWNKGKKLSKEHIEKLIISHVGVHCSPKTEFKKGIIPWNKGKKFPNKCGKNHHNWKGGISPLRNKIYSTFEYRQWRSDVFTRDDYACQECNQEGGNLEAHHIISFNTLIRKHEITNVKQALRCSELWNINNGLTLCKKCHRKTNNFGLRPRKRQVWQDI